MYFIVNGKKRMKYIADMVNERDVVTCKYVHKIIYELATEI